MKHYLYIAHLKPRKKRYDCVVHIELTGICFVESKEEAERISRDEAIKKIQTDSMFSGFEIYDIEVRVFTEADKQRGIHFLLDMIKELIICNYYSTEEKVSHFKLLSEKLEFIFNLDTRK